MFLKEIVIFWKDNVPKKCWIAWVKAVTPAVFLNLDHELSQEQSEQKVETIYNN